MRWIKQLFCKHHQQHLAYIYQYKYNGIKRSYFRCLKCEKIVHKDYPYNEYGTTSKINKRKPKRRKSSRYIFNGSAAKRQRKEKTYKTHWKYYRY